MVNRQKKALGWVDTITQGSRMITGKKVARALTNKAASGIESYKKGGKVKMHGKKSIMIKAHAGEVVLPKKTVNALKKLLH